MHHHQMITNIDIEADIIREFVVGNPVRVFEYQWAESEATAFKTGGYAGAVPISVSSWATAKGWTAQQACDDILAAAANFRSVMATIRNTRLVGKEGIRANEGNSEAAEVAYQTAMQTFSALRAQIGM